MLNTKKRVECYYYPLETDFNPCDILAHFFFLFQIFSTGILFCLPRSYIDAKQVNQLLKSTCVIKKNNYMVLHNFLAEY